MTNNRHRSFTIHNWKKRGLISDDYKKLYEKVMNTERCELCNVKFDDISQNKRCMDHCHKTGLYRKTLCNGCNASHERKPKHNKIGFSYLNYNKSGNTTYICYNKRGFKKRNFKTLTQALAYSFFMNLKY
tara:strand:+ start:46 stop:435 length:390 start_codon:yes stop_codon:yes gene_type:complete